MQIDDARRLLRSRADLAAAGMTPRGLERALRDGTLRRVDHGFYVPAKTRKGVFSEDRHLLRVVAADARGSGSDAVASISSAGVLHGLPLFRVEPTRVHVSGLKVNGRAYRGGHLVARHEVAVPSQDIVEIDGIRCTSLPRTVADLIRHLPAEAAVSAADAALRQVAWDADARTYHLDAAEQIRVDVLRRLPRGGRGVRQARWAIGFADGRAESPGETVSRMYIVELGFAPPRLQVCIPGPKGSDLRTDFGLDDVPAWGEFDGKGKYLDPALRGDRDIEEAVLAEKAREDWIRATTNRRLARWGFEHITSAAALGMRLAFFHIRPPR